MAEDEEDGTLWIDGEKFTVEDLTFKERRQVRKAVMELNDDDPDFQLAFADPVVDTIPAIVWVVKRRTDPDYPMAKVLDLKPDDLAPPAPAKGQKRRPTGSASST